MGAAANMPIRRAALLMLLMLAAPACQVAPGQGRLGGWDFAVDKTPELWGEFKPDRVYELQRDVFLLDIPERTNGPALLSGMEWSVPPDTVRGPTTVAEYHAHPKNWLRVPGVVTAGTRLRAEVLRGKGNLRDKEATVHYVRARLLDGPFQDKLVDLQAISLYAADPDSRRIILRGPNEDFLTLAP